MDEIKVRLELDYHHWALVKKKGYLLLSLGMRIEEEFNVDLEMNKYLLALLKRGKTIKIIEFLGEKIERESLQTSSQFCLEHRVIKSPSIGLNF